MTQETSITVTLTLRQKAVLTTLLRQDIAAAEKVLPLFTGENGLDDRQAILAEIAENQAIVKLLEAAKPTYPNPWLWQRGKAKR